MLLAKIIKFKVFKSISEFLLLLYGMIFAIFSTLMINKIFDFTNEFELRLIYSILFILISILIFYKSLIYICKLKILNFYQFFNKEEVLNNLNLFKKEDLENYLLVFFENNKDFISGNIKKITANYENKEWIIKLDLDTEQKKILLLDKDLDWYSRQVSTRELYLYLESAITDIIEKEESEYYIVLINLFSDFISIEQLQKMKNVINVEQKTLIINI